jgi:hypothetical protein
MRPPQPNTEGAVGVSRSNTVIPRLSLTGSADKGSRIMRAIFIDGIMSLADEIFPHPDLFRRIRRRRSGIPERDAPIFSRLYKTRLGALGYTAKRGIAANSRGP